MTEVQIEMWDYWQEHPRGKTNEEELKRLVIYYAQLLTELEGENPGLLSSGELSMVSKGLSYADS